MDTCKKWLLSLYIIYTALSAIAIAFVAVVYYGFDKPLTLGYEYFGDIEIPKVNDEGEYVVDKKPIIEVNLVRSSTNSSLNLSEVVITSYTDYEHNDYNRYAMQVLGNFDIYCPAGLHFGGLSKEFSSSYYSSTLIEPYANAREALFNMTSTEDIVPFLYTPKGMYLYTIDSNEESINIKDVSYFNELLSKIQVTADNESFMLAVGGSDAQYSYTCEEYTSKWNKFWGKRSTTEPIYNSYNKADLFYVLVSMFDSKRSDCVVSVKNVDLDKYLTIYKSDNKNRFYKLEEVSINTAYFKIKCTYKTITSYLSAEDSIIGKINGNAQYSSGVKNVKTPFYTIGVNLDINHLNSKAMYNSGMNKYFVGITNVFNNYLKTLNNLSLSIYIDLNEYDVVISGIDLRCFDGLNISSITVASSDTIDFYVIGSNKTVNSTTFNGNINLLNESGGSYA